MGVLLSNFVSC